MRGKVLAGIIFSLLFLSTLTLMSAIQRVKAVGTIYIRADGSVDPPTANITTLDNVTYTFTGDIVGDADGIVIERNNIILDGAGYALQGSGTYGAGINLTERSNVTVKNMEIEAFRWGVYLWEASNNTISGNEITENSDGILLDGYSNNNTISGNTITNHSDGILLDDSSNNNSISGNTITNEREGIWLDNSLDNNVYENNITNNRYGIVFVGSSNNNSVSGNRITNNVYGIWLEYSSDNKLYHNNCVNNTQQVHLETSGYANLWDNGFEGNYWSNYTGVDSDHDGIGDSWHEISENNTDHHPLFGPFHRFNTTFGEPINVISNSTIESFQYFESNSTIKMYVSNMTANQTFGFCRMAIPKSLMPPPYTVIIDNGLTDVLYFNDTIYDNDTHRWLFFAYEHSTSKIEILPEFPSLLILPLFLIATLVIVVYVKKRKRARTQSCDAVCQFRTCTTSFTLMHNVPPIL